MSKKNKNIKLIKGARQKIETRLDTFCEEMEECSECVFSCGECRFCLLDDKTLFTYYQRYLDCLNNEKLLEDENE